MYKRLAAGIWRFMRRLRTTYGRWQEDDGMLLAAAVAYYAALSFFPLLLVLISGLGLVMQLTQWGQDSEQQVLAAIGEYASPAVENNVKEMLEGVQRRAVIGGPLGLGALLLTAAALFAHFERAFDRMWHLETPETKGIWGAARNILFYRLRAFLLLFALGVLILVIFLVGVIFASVRQYAQDVIPINQTVWRVLETGVSLTLNTGVFCLTYRLLPKVPVRWSEALRGAILTAIVWELGRVTLTLVLVGDKYSAYGVVGSFIAVMLWIYYASTVLFLGAEYVQVICKECHPRDARTTGTDKSPEKR